MRKESRAVKALSRGVLVAAVALALLAACGRDNSTSNLSGVTSTPVGANSAQLASCASGTADVIMQNEAFIPAVITVPVNKSIKWTNNDASGNYWIIMGSFESPRVGPGQSICLEFTAPGTYEYHCDPLVR